MNKLWQDNVKAKVGQDQQPEAWVKQLGIIPNILILLPELEDLWLSLSTPGRHQQHQDGEAAAQAYKQRDPADLLRPQVKQVLPELQRLGL